MGKFCEVCGKGKMSGNNVSHSNRKTKRCLRSGKIVRSV